MSVGAAVSLVLALASTTLTNPAYPREHNAAAELPRSVHAPAAALGAAATRRPELDARIRDGVFGFLLSAAALALAPLALVQSIAAGGFGVLASASARLARRRLSSYELMGVLISVFGLVALGVSLAAGGGKDGRGSTMSILLWLGATARVAIMLVLLGRKSDRGRGGGWYGRQVVLLDRQHLDEAGHPGRRSYPLRGDAGHRYTAATALLQLGYQASGALTVAGLATLLTNALPIAAGTIVLDTPVPPGALGRRASRA